LAFACDLVATERPKLLVELGAFYGESYFGFCQALEERSILCNCYAVDTWQGDDQGGFYGEEIYADVEAYNRAHYSSFSHLMRMTFDEALSYFSDDGIDILHIDGHHSYESVRSDFECWIRKVRPGGIVLLHDICVRSAGFGVWRLWEELRESFPHFAFTHSAGLGVVVKPGAERRGTLLDELISADSEEQALVARYYSVAAERCQLAFDSAQLRAKTANPVSTPIQVFYSLGQGYSEENSAVRLLATGQRKRITFELPKGIPAKPLRIDPADRACIAEFFEISVLAADRSQVLWRWDGSGPAPAFQVGGTARLLPSQTGMAVVSDGIDPQVLLPDIGGELFERPLELDIVVRITSSVEFYGRIVPLGDLDGVNEAPELDRAFLHDEVRSMLTELSRRVSARDEARDSVVAEVSRLASLLTDESTRMIAALETVRTAALSTEIVELRNNLENERLRCKELQQSWSWRVTAPARFILGRFRHSRTR
jgi:Methyltransferase domain